MLLTLLYEPSDQHVSSPISIAGVGIATKAEYIHLYSYLQLAIKCREHGVNAAVDESISGTILKILHLKPIASLSVAWPWFLNYYSVPFRDSCRRC